MSQQRPEHVKALYAGSKRLAPGLYQTAGGDFLMNTAEVLAVLGLADTAENRALCAELMKELCREQGIPHHLLGPPEKE